MDEVYYGTADTIHSINDDLTDPPRRISFLIFWKLLRLTLPPEKPLSMRVMIFSFRSSGLIIILQIFNLRFTADAVFTFYRFTGIKNNCHMIHFLFLIIMIYLHGSGKKILA